MGGARVLLVDDEHELVTTIAERLELRGYTVDAVTDGNQALERSRAATYDVVVLDLKMPGIGGAAVLAQLEKEQPDLPVILLTGHISTIERDEGLAQGAFAYLLKPVNLEELLQAIRRATEGRDGTR
jgi:CheY-like chemotaxis protein